MIKKDDIYLKNTIVHILDSVVAVPVLSDEELPLGSEFADFLKEHISRIVSGDDLKECVFNEDSYVYGQISAGWENNFIGMSKNIANHLFTIMNQNVDIPQADFIICRFLVYEMPYLAFLKMNYYK